MSIELAPSEYRSTPHHEVFPSNELVTRSFIGLTANIAARVGEHIQTFAETGYPKEKKDRIAILDTAAAESMERSLATFPFSVVSVGSEGGKEKHNGKLGVAMPTVLGRFGGGNGEVWMVNDPVENTTAAAYGDPGAISVVAVSDRGGIMATPDGVHYMDKLFAPPKAAGCVNIYASNRYNMSVVCDEYGIRPKELTVVVLNRERNAKTIDDVREFGANLKLIEGGDLVPSLLAVLPPESHHKGVHMVMGIGGWEEGVIAATAARAVGGAAEGQAWVGGTSLERLTLESLVPGKPEHSMVIFSAITDDPWFPLPGVTPEGRGTLVRSLVIDHHGVHDDRYQFVPRP